jgi:hypothetical protein
MDRIRRLQLVGSLVVALLIVVAVLVQVDARLPAIQDRSPERFEGARDLADDAERAARDAQRQRDRDAQDD